MICSNCGYNNEAAPSDAAPCAFCGYRGVATADTITENAIPAILGAVEAPPVVEAASGAPPEVIAL